MRTKGKERKIDRVRAKQWTERRRISLIKKY
jgi:hypothetical protein